MDINVIGKRAKEAEKKIRNLSTKEKNQVLQQCAKALVTSRDYILQENMKDVKNGQSRGMAKPLLDRLLLTEDRINAMAEGLLQIASLKDPVGEVISMEKMENQLLIGKKRVPLGVIGIIYEARPNVTSDAFGLCFKAGNVVILKGGSDAINSNIAVVAVLRSAIEKAGYPENAIQLIEDTSHEVTNQFMKLKEYVDVLIPRGGRGLIDAVVKNSTIPVIETGTGNCHVYVDESADVKMACNIILNAKTQRTGVCNACESILVHKNIVEELMPILARLLEEKGVEARCDETCLKYFEKGVEATEDDWGREYLDLILSTKVVDTIDEAIEHINKYNTGHSEAIVTESYTNAQKFLDEVDAAAVYVNASTRFTDGFEFGFGGEIGISTQKLHARGPMGLEALTSTKYIIYGNGQIRK